MCVCLSVRMCVFVWLVTGWFILLSGTLFEPGHEWTMHCPYPECPLCQLAITNTVASLQFLPPPDTSPPTHRHAHMHAHVHVYVHTHKHPATWLPTTPTLHCIKQLNTHIVWLFRGMRRVGGGCAAEQGQGEEEGREREERGKREGGQHEHWLRCL